MIGNCGVMRLMLAVLLLGAALSCGGGAGPDALPVSALSGVYSVTFAPEETARCPAIRVTLDAQVTWGGCDIEVYTGRREPDHIILQRPIAGLYGFSSIDFYRFESFRGSPARATSAWVAGCKTPNADGTPATCSGTATWVRE